MLKCQIRQDITWFAMWEGVLYAMNSQILSAKDVFVHVAHLT